MLNLLRLRAVADYSATPELAPESPVSGRAAFDLYIAHTLPLLRERGGDLLFLGDGGTFLVGPEEERWDLAMLVRQQSVEVGTRQDGWIEILGGIEAGATVIADGAYYLSEGAQVLVTREQP